MFYIVLTLVISFRYQLICDDWFFAYNSFLKQHFFNVFNHCLLLQTAAFYFCCMQQISLCVSVGKVKTFKIFQTTTPKKKKKRNIKTIFVLLWVNVWWSKWGICAFKIVSCCHFVVENKCNINHNVNVALLVVLIVTKPFWCKPISQCCASNASNACCMATRLGFFCIATQCVGQ